MLILIGMFAFVFAAMWIAEKVEIIALSLFEEES